MLALVFGLCRWSANFGRLLVVYYRIAQISRLNLGSAGPLAVEPFVLTFWELPNLLPYGCILFIVSIWE